MTDPHDRAAARRDILPVPDVAHFGLTTYAAKDPDTSYRPIRDVQPPEGAPNVLVILIDDVGFGFGASSAFGGPCDTPNFEKLAAGGLKYNRFHTTPHHGTALADAPGAPDGPQPSFRGHGQHHRDCHCGNRIHVGSAEHQGTAPPDPEAQRLLDGAVREVPRSAGLADQPRRPFTAWPTGGGGFEYFYGFIGGENNRDPALYEGTTAIEPPKTPAEGYHLTEDLTDKAINWARQQKALPPDKPFGRSGDACLRR